MKGKILFVVGLGVGYVLGARAGRERYEQIRKAAEDVWNQPKVQEGVQTVKDFAMSRAGDVGDTVLDGAKKLVAQVTQSNGSTTRSGSPASKPAASRSSASKPSASGTGTGTGTASSGTPKAASSDSKAGSGTTSSGSPSSPSSS
jgi:hypothetical protein